MRPAACAEQLVSCAATATCKHVAPSSYFLSRRHPFTGRRVLSKQHPVSIGKRERVIVTARTSSRQPSQGPIARRQLRPETVQARISLGNVWKPILKALLLVPLLFLPVILRPKAAFSHTARPVALPSVRTVEVWPCNHTPHEHTVSSISDSTTSPSPISTTGVTYSTVGASHTVNSGQEGAISSSHEQVSSQLDQIVAEHSVTQLAVAVALAILLILALRSSQLKHAGSHLRDSRRSSPVQPQSYEPRPISASPQYDSGDDEDDSYGARPDSQSGLSVEQRRRQASRAIAEAKARQAAFASQGTSQFTDADIIQPEAPDFGHDRESSDDEASATTTTILDPTRTPRSERQMPEDLDNSSRRSQASGATDTFALDDPSPRQDSSASSSRQRQQSSFDLDSSKPLYAQGRADLKPRSDSEHSAREQAQAELKRKPNQSVSQGPSSATGRQAPAATEDQSSMSASADRAPRSRPVTPEPSPVKLGGRAEAGEHSARQNAMAELQRQTKQPVMSDMEAASRFSKAADERESAQDSTDTPEPELVSGKTSGPITGEPVSAKLGGRAAPGKQDARQNAMAELQRQSKQPAMSSEQAVSQFAEAAQERASARESQPDRPKSAAQDASSSKQSVTPSPAPVKLGGRAPPGEQNARQKAMAWLQRQTKQPAKADLEAATVFVEPPQAPKPNTDRTASQADGEQAPTAPVQGQQASALPPSGRAPPGEYKAREKAMADLKRKSQQTQQIEPVDLRQVKDQSSGPGKSQQLGMSPEQAAAVYQPRSAASEQAQSKQQSGLLSEKDQTSDLASSLASSSMSAEPAVSDVGRVTEPRSAASEKKQSKPQSELLSEKDQTSDLASSLASSSTSAKLPVSNIGRVAEPSAAQVEKSQNRVLGYFSAAQAAISGRKTAQTSGLSVTSSTAAQETDSPSSPMQAQVPARDATAAQRMASGNQAQAVERARQKQKSEVVVRKYQPVDLPGNVDEFVRPRGVRAPLLLLYGLAASAAQTLEPMWPAAQPEASRGDGMLDFGTVNWAQLRKYDIFQQMLNAASSSPTAQEERFSPLRSIANAVPQEGVPKYDFLRDLLRSAAQPRDTKPSSQALASSSSSESEAGWTLPPSLDPLAALLQDAKQPWRAPDSKYDPFNALNRALADPEEPTGSVAALDPLGNLLKADQGEGKVAQAARSKYDPFQAGWQSSSTDAPSSSAPAERRETSTPRQPINSKYDLFQQLFKAQGPSSETASLDPLGAVLQSLRQPWDRLPSSKYDVFQAIFALEGPDSRRPGLDSLSALQQDRSGQPKDSVKSKYDVFQALFQLEGPDAQRPGLDPLSGLRANTSAQPTESVKSKYDPFQALFNLQGPNAQRPAVDPLSGLQGDTPAQPTKSVKSKYDPFQALFNLEGPDAQRPSTDPLSALQQNSPAQPTESVKSKYDPFQALFQSEGPSSNRALLDPFASFLERIQKPRQPPSSKYDIFQAILKLQGPNSQPTPLDPLGAAFRDTKQPWRAPKSKYDPFQALFRSQMPVGDAALDPLPNLMKAMTASSLLKKQQEQQQRQQEPNSTRSDKYNPVQQLLSADAPTGRTPGFDPLGALLKSSWVKDRRSKPQQQEPSSDASEESTNFGPGYWGVRAGQQTPGKGPWQPTPSSRSRQQAPSGSQSLAADQQDMAQFMQQRVTQQQQRPVDEHEARQRAMAALQAKAKGQTVTDDEEAEQQQLGTSRPSEWAGFIYNPYSGDLLPQNDDDDNENLGSEGSGGRPGSEYGSSSKGGASGQGKTQFVSANASVRPTTKRQAFKVYALHSTAADVGAVAAEGPPLYEPSTSSCQGLPSS